MLRTAVLIAGAHVPLLHGGGLTPLAGAAHAFENRLPPDEIELKYKSPRNPGPKPTDLGPRNGNQLKPCTDGKPHCFSSSQERFEDDDLCRTYQWPRGVAAM